MIKANHEMHFTRDHEHSLSPLITITKVFKEIFEYINGTRTCQEKVDIFVAPVTKHIEGFYSMNQNVEISCDTKI